ncbi:PadR family transcriptional regulator [Parahaliea aestuarii]|uniref:PadR family transcriptional regulator n=1 Tax=Parahaliea aestuarii TaxID=1852021 RepID=A0A5C9A599_9GAMM|nr:PadR family transcriptional regulator [Parahaliea aestuarii]TXS94381.1 PadR family transcriptional regulator [Parahaliea aestuarii]
METPLNTTAYSLLGLLAKRDWSAAELAAFMERSVIRYILPRTRSQLFSEPKKLVKLGLATVHPAPDGGRQRKVYRISASGRRALKRWLQAPGDPVRIEHKSLLKFYLTDFRDRAAQRERVAEMREQALTSLRDTHAELRRIVDEGVVFEQTAVPAAMVSNYAANHFRGQIAWLDELAARIETIPQDAEVNAWALARYRESCREIEALLAEQREP